MAVKYNQSTGIRPAAAKDAAPRKDYSTEIEQLSRRITQFRIDSQRFLAGDLEIPPEEARDAIQRDLRRLQSSPGVGSGEMFRLGSLEAQFNSQAQLFDRRLREQEQGGRRAVAKQDEKPDPYAGVVLGSKSVPGAVESLYQGMYLRGGNRQPKMDLERFRAHMGRQVEALRAKTGCRDIQFRIAEEGGKLKIKAKPIRSKT